MNGMIGLLAAAVGFCAFVADASATPITYVETGLGSGTLGGVAFGSLAPLSFTITASDNTLNVTSCGAGCLRNDSTLANIQINGLGTFQFTSATAFFANVDTVGFARGGLAGEDLFDGLVTGAYDMVSSFGPIPGTASLLQWALPAVVTTGGVLVFNDGTSSATFTASVGNASVPEPSTLAFFGAGLFGLGAVCCRRKARA